MKKAEWVTAKTYEDITYKKSNGVARIAFNRPNVRNAFRPKTTSELYDAFYDANEDVIRNRIKVYYAETAILKGFYQQQDKYFGVDGVGSIEDITDRLSTVIDKL